MIDKPRVMLFIRDVSLMLSQALHIFDRHTTWAPVLALTPGIYSHPDSFEQLAAISRHPVISQHVTYLIYESDILDRYESQDEWECNLVGEYVRVRPPAYPGVSDREYIASRYEWDMEGPPPHQLPRETLDRVYAEYQRIFTLQEQIRDQDYGVSMISEAISHLPKLTSISTSFTPNPREHHRYLVGQWRTWLQRPFDNLGYGQPRGTSQLRSLLLGCYTAEIQLTRLELGEINWQFLQNESEENMRMMKRSLRHLRELKLNITLEYDVCDQVYDTRTEFSGRQEHLNHALYNFTNAALMLESLSVSIKIDPINCQTELKHIVSDHHWTNLRRVHFENICATQADFAIFFSHHASTLRHLSLKDIELLPQGSWIPTLENMQKTLSLDTAKIRGSLYCVDPPQYWTQIAFCHRNGFDHQGERNFAALSRYLVYGGTCPLLDEENMPNRA